MPRHSPTLPVMIAGGGIGGIALGLTLHQIGVPFVIFEASAKLRPLGVGINLQPNAVRELFDLGLTDAQLGSVGLPIREWTLVGRNGNGIYAEPRGREAGYHWPQYAVHRGRMHMMLAETLRTRAGSEALREGQRVTGYEIQANGTVIAQLSGADGTVSESRGSLLIGADGIHSAVRAQMHPDQPPIHWGGAIMWRGTTRATPIRTGASFVGLGGEQQRMIIYPIGQPDPETGLVETNWIAEVTVDASTGWQHASWFGEARAEDPLTHFRDWTYDWLDVPNLISGADAVFENAMIDRDPVATWQDRSVALMGDAAHAMYPTGSNGASQAIIDARELGAAFLMHGLGPDALAAYDAKLCGPVSELVLRNRGQGPFGLLTEIDRRCGGVFEDIDAVIPQVDRDAFMASYKAAAGFAIDALNSAPPTIPPGAQLT